MMDKHSIPNELVARIEYLEQNRKEIKVFDKNLSTYYLSSGRLFDNYSVRLDTKDFSNISGGYGIFGSFIVQKISVLFSDEYLSIFGLKQSN